MKNDTMMIEDFEERAMAYGADLDVWPEEDRAPARALLAISADARRAMDDARALDEALALWDGPTPSQALLSRVLTDAATVAGEAPGAASATAPRAGQGWLASVFGMRPMLRPGLALAACLALGFVMGTTLEEQVMIPVDTQVSEDAGMIDFAFALEDDSDLLLGPEALL